MTQKKAKKAAQTQAKTDGAGGISALQALREDLQGTPTDRVSQSGRPVYHPTTMQWVTVAMALVFTLCALSSFNDGNSQQGLFCIVLAVLSAVAFAVLTINRKK